MESVALAGLAGSGYLLNPNNETESKVSSKSTKNIFDQNYFKKASQIEQDLVSKRLGERSVANGVHTAGYIGRPSANASLGAVTTRNNEIQSLTGKVVNKEQFVHNNMVPFFGSHVRQSTLDNGAQTRLEHFTGVEKNHIKRQEVSNMFDVQRENIYGTPVVNDQLEQRYNPSRFRQGVPLTEPVQVGPGLNKGYTSNPSGGFQQEDSRQFTLPKNVDDLRVKNKPKVSFESRFTPAFGGSRRGQTGEFSQNRVVRYHHFDEPRFNTTVVQTAQTKRPETTAKNTARQYSHQAYTGGAGPSVVKKHENYSNYAPEIVHKQNLGPGGMRNASGGYKEPKIVYCSEVRETDREKDSSYMSNFGTAVKKMFLPKEDIAKTTIKETNVHDTHSGFMQSGVNKQTIYDTDDITKTTIKETLIHDTRSGQMARIANKGTIPNQDVSKTTSRETLKNFVTTANMSGSLRGNINNIEALTTVRETMVHTPEKGGAVHNKGKGYTTTGIQVPATNKQHKVGYTGISTADGHEKGAYTATKYNAPDTLKQDKVDYTGIAQSDTTKQVSYQDIYNATFNDIKEGLVEGRPPTKTSAKNYQENIGDLTLNNPLCPTDNLHVNKMANIQLDSKDQAFLTEKEALETLDRFEDLEAFKNNPFTQSLQSY